MCCRICDKNEVVHYFILLFKYTDNDMSMVLHDIDEYLPLCELNNKEEVSSVDDSAERNNIASVATDDSFYTEFIESVLAAGPTVPRHCSNDINSMNGNINYEIQYYLQ